MQWINRFGIEIMSFMGGKKTFCEKLKGYLVKENVPFDDVKSWMTLHSASSDIYRVTHVT